MALVEMEPLWINFLATLRWFPTLKFLSVICGNFCNLFLLVLLVGRAKNIELDLCYFEVIPSSKLTVGWCYLQSVMLFGKCVVLFGKCVVLFGRCVAVWNVCCPLLFYQYTAHRNSLVPRNLYQWAGACQYEICFDCLAMWEGLSDMCQPLSIWLCLLYLVSCNNI